MIEENARELLEIMNNHVDSDLEASSDGFELWYDKFEDVLKLPEYCTRDSWVNNYIEYTKTGGNEEEFIRLYGKPLEGFIHPKNFGVRLSMIGLQKLTFKLNKYLNFDYQELLSELRPWYRIKIKNMTIEKLKIIIDPIESRIPLPPEIIEKLKNAKINIID